MDDVLRDCATFAVVYIDNILIFSDSIEEHLSHITEGQAKEVPMGGKTARIFRARNWQWTVPEHRVQAMMEFKQPVTK